MPTPKRDEHDERIANLEKLLEQHLAVCSQQREDLRRISDLLDHIDASIRVAHKLRNFIVWLSGLTAAAYSLFEIFTRGK